MQYPKQTDNYDVDIFNANFRELAGSVISLDTEKFDKTEAQGLFKDVAFNRGNGVITFTLYDGSVKIIDTLLEKLAVNFDFDRETQRLIITLDDGTEKYVDLSAFITQYEFLDSETIAFVLGEDGKVSAKIKEGSIEEKHLRPNYLADIKTEAAKAEAARQDAQESQRETEEAEANAVASAAASAENANSARTAAEEALEAKTKAQKAAVDAESYAHGGTGTREGEDQDNANFYYQQSKVLHDNILAAGGASEEKAGLMSAHDKSWLDGKFRRYIYGSESAGEDKRGYYKIASVESDLLNHSYAIRLLIWSPNHANFPVAPIEVTVYFQTGNSSNNSTKVFTYCDLATASSWLFRRNIVVKHTVNAAVGKCEIYFDRNIDTATIAIDVMGEMERNVTTSEEKYQKVWTFYDNFIAPDPIEEEGYVLKPLIECMNGATVGSDTTPIYIDKGIPKPCASLPAGTTDYDDLDNKPLINGVELSGNKRPYDLGVCPITSQRDLGLGTPQTAIGYVIVNGQIYGQSDGAMYEQAYNDNWFHQIYGDYRTGQIATRGRNNGAWGKFRRQLDEFNYIELINNFSIQPHDKTSKTISSGYIKIRLLNRHNWMFSCVIRIYQNYIATDILVSGYLYGDEHWYLPKATMISCTDDTPLIINFGYDEDGVEWIGFRAYDYYGVSICNINDGYTGMSNTDKFSYFTIGHVSSLGGTIQNSYTLHPPMKRNDNGGYIVKGNLEMTNNSIIKLDAQLSSPAQISSNAFAYNSGGGVTVYGYVLITSPGGVGGVAIGKNAHSGYPSLWSVYANQTLGKSDARWGQIYTTTAVDVSSDSREKTDQKPLDDELTEKFVLGLKPKSYKRIDGTSGRRHHGLIAQEIEELMENLGISSLDFAGFIKSPKTEEIEEEDPETGEMTKTCREIEGEYIYSLRYEEFLPMLIKMIQIQHDKIKALENENLRLSERLARIEEYLELV